MIDLEQLKVNLTEPWCSALGDWRTVGYHGRQWGKVELVQFREPTMNLFIIRSGVVKFVSMTPEIAFDRFKDECLALDESKPPFSHKI